MKRPRLGHALVTGVLWLLLAAGTASAASITVNTTSDAPVDASHCTLRQAIESANGNPPTGANNCTAGDPSPTVDTINVTATGTISVGSTLPTIASDMNIDGPGQSLLDVNAGTPGGYVPFIIQAGTPPAVTISDLTVSHATRTATTDLTGGALINGGDLTLDRVTVTANALTATSATPNSNLIVSGAGIYNGSNGTLTVAESTVSGNTLTVTQSGTGLIRATASGAGIENGGTATVENSIVSGNTATASNLAGTDSGSRANSLGAGIDTSNNTLTIEGSTVSGNIATATQTGSGTNTAGNASSGIHLNHPLILRRSTVSANSAAASGGQFHVAVGGVHNDGFAGTIAATGDTISANSAAGIANLLGDGTAANNTIQDTIVSNPQGGGPNCAGALTSQGFNLESGAAPGSCQFSQPTDLHADPLLDPVGLANNGGPTPTLALQPGSPALDKGISAGATTDQRGLARIADFGGLANAAGGDGSDIGAFESQLGCAGQATPSTSCAPAVAAATGQRAAALKKCKKKKTKKKRKKCKKKANKLPV